MGGGVGGGQGSCQRHWTEAQTAMLAFSLGLFKMTTSKDVSLLFFFFLNLLKHKFVV